MKPLAPIFFFAFAASAAAQEAETLLLETTTYLSEQTAGLQTALAEQNQHLDQFKSQIAQDKDRVASILKVVVEHLGQLESDVSRAVSQVESCERRLAELADEHRQLRSDFREITERTESLEHAAAQSIELLSPAVRSDRREQVISMIVEKESAEVRLSPGEPTIIQFPKRILGGYKRVHSPLSLDRQDENVIVFLNPEGEMPERGDAIVVRMEDGRFVAVRLLAEDAAHPRDPIVRLSE